MNSKEDEKYVNGYIDEEYGNKEYAEYEDADYEDEEQQEYGDEGYTIKEVKKYFKIINMNLL